MVRKVQLPVVGGIRKTIVIPDATASGTTITEYGDGSVSLAQLRLALNVPNATTSNGAGGPTASLIPGPGLQGGGPILGNVPLRVDAFPWSIMDGGGSGDDGLPGPPGVQGPAGAGATGPAGPIGNTPYFEANDGEDGYPAIPGSPGAAGPAGATGAGGPAGAAVYFALQDGEDGSWGPPGKDGVIGTNGVSGAPGAAVWFLSDEGVEGERGPPGKDGTGGGTGGGAQNINPDTHPTSPNALDDEFEAGTLDAKWTAHNATGIAATALAQGALEMNSDATGAGGGGTSCFSITQPLPGGTAWRFRSKFQISVLTGNNNGGLAVRESSSSKMLVFGAFCNSGALEGAMLYFTGDLAFSSLPIFAPLQNTSDNLLRSRPLYWEVELLSGSLIYRLSESGYNGTFTVYTTLAVATYFTTAPDQVGFSTDPRQSTGTNPALLSADWFRRMA